MSYNGLGGLVHISPKVSPIKSSTVLYQLFDSLILPIAHCSHLEPLRLGSS